MVLWKPCFPDRNAGPPGERMNKLEETAERLFGEALDLPREQRPAFLDRVCVGNPPLR